MQAVIFADRHGSELTPLCDRQCPALLHIANRPLLQHCIEEIVDAGIDKILVVISDDAQEIETYFGNGDMWGITINYALSRGEESTNELLVRYASRLEPDFLAVRGDVLHTTSTRQFLDETADQTGKSFQACLGNSPIGMFLVREWSPNAINLDWPLNTKVAPNSQQIELSNGYFFALDSIQSLYKASVAASNTIDQPLTPPGLEIEPGLRVGKLSHVNPLNRLDGSILIGDNVWIHKSVNLSGPCIISDNCYIDRGAEISNSIVMPGTYLGENLSIENSIVDRDTLVRIDRDISLQITDKQLINQSYPEIKRTLQHWSERMTGLILLIASLPLWPFAYLISFIASPRSPLLTVKLIVNAQYSKNGIESAQQKSSRLFHTSIPLLRNLPLLWLVAKGDLLLFGSRPLNNQVLTLSPRPSRLRQALQVGMLGPAQLFLPRIAPEEEIYLSELDFASRKGLKTFVLRLLLAARLLISSRAWMPLPSAIMDK